MLHKLCRCMFYKEMNSISFKSSVQILYIVLCNYCTTCIIYRDKVKFKLIAIYNKITMFKIASSLVSIIFGTAPHDSNYVRCSIGGFRDSQSDVIFAHAYIRGRQWYGQLYGICVKSGFIFREKWAFIANVISTLVCIL